MQGQTYAEYEITKLSIAHNLTILNNFTYENKINIHNKSNKTKN